MKNFVFFVLFFFLCSLCSCITSHTEKFHGDKDSVNYYRNGSVEWSWRNK